MTNINTNSNNKRTGGQQMTIDELLNIWEEHLIEVGFDQLDAYSLAYRKVIIQKVRRLPKTYKEHVCIRNDDDGNRCNSLNHYNDEYSYHNNYNEYNMD